MRLNRIYWLAALLLCVGQLWALHVEPVGEPDADYTFVDNGGDTIYIFATDIHMRHKEGNTDWYDVNDQLLYANIDEIYPDEGGYYTLQDGVKEYFYVFSYKDYQANTTDWSLTVTPTCDATTLTLSGTLPKAMNYTIADGRTRTVNRQCIVTYNELKWSDAWTDSLVTQSFTFPQTSFSLPALFGATEITLTVDNLAKIFGMTPATISVALDEPIAVTSHVLNTTVKRDATNENDRPKNDSTLSGSGVLDIQFYSNPSPAATYFEWKIYQGTSLLYTRNDENLHEVFSEPGAYRVIYKVKGVACPCETCEPDSTELTVTIKNSYVRVPNVFTPNGDGQNDEFRVEYRSIVEFHCWVYNRWGKLVYEWTDPAKGWDGTIGGHPAAEGAYFYVIRARGSDAAPNQGYVGKPTYNRWTNDKQKSDNLIGIYQLSGDINLIRGSKK